jgi:hypothetical protein
MSFEPQHPTMLYPWGCPCSTMIEGDFVPKGAKQFGHSSQDLDCEYVKSTWCYYFRNNLYWWYRLKRKRKSDKGRSGMNLGFSYKTRRTIIGGEWVFKKANEFALTNLSSWYRNTLLARFLGMAL